MKTLGQVAPWKQRRQNASHDEVTASSEAQGRLWGTEQRICSDHSLTRWSPPHLQWNTTVLSLSEFLAVLLVSPRSRSQGTAYIFSCLPILLKKLWKSWEFPKAPKLECNRKPTHRLPWSCNLLSYANKIYATQCNSIKTKVHFHSCKVPKSSESSLSSLSVPSGDTVERGSWGESLVSRGQRGC